MNRARRIGQAWVVAACIAGRTAHAAQPEPATAPEPPPADAASSLEISAALAPSVVFGERANAAYAQSSFRRAGLFGEVAFAYRSRYFIDPFISVGYATLASGKTELPSGPWGAGGTLEQSLGAWVIAPGITVDIWRIRLRYGLGIAVVVQSFGYLGQDHSSTQLPIAHQFGLGFNALDTGGFRLDTEMRLVRAGGADVTFMTLGIVARGDLLRFGGRKK